MSPRMPFVLNGFFVLLFFGWQALALAVEDIGWGGFPLLFIGLCVAVLLNVFLGCKALWRQQYAPALLYLSCAAAIAAFFFYAVSRFSGKIGG